MAKSKMSKKIVGILIAAIIFSTLLPEIISQFAIAVLNLTGTAARIVGTVLTLFIVLGFMYYIAVEMDLV